MVAGLETFAKVRALHDRATIPGERDAAKRQMKKLAHKAGMTVDEAVSTLDAPAPAPRGIFDELFNTPEFRAQKTERERRYAEQRAAALAEYGSEEAVWQPNEREQSLTEACRPFIVRKPIIGGEMDTLLGWDLFSRWEKLPPEVRRAVADAYGSPTSVREAWTEYQDWQKVGDDRTAFFDCYDHNVRVRARTGLIEHLLDTLPARSMNDLRARLDWMQHINEREWNRGNPEDSTLLATLRADVERMGQRIREQDRSDRRDADGVQSGQSQEGSTGTSQNPSDALATVQSGHTRRTNADKRRDVAALLNTRPEGISLTDREIARRAGVSPTTVGTIRRSLA